MCLVFIKVLRQSLSLVGEKSSTTLVHNKKQIEEKQMTDKKLTKTQETELVAPSSFEEDGGLGQECRGKPDRW